VTILTEYSANAKAGKLCNYIENGQLARFVKTFELVRKMRESSRPSEKERRGDSAVGFSTMYCGSQMFVSKSLQVY